jgi:hypothetical protein
MTWQKCKAFFIKWQNYFLHANFVISHSFIKKILAVASPRPSTPKRMTLERSMFEARLSARMVAAANTTNCGETEADVHPEPTVKYVFK